MPAILGFWVTGLGCILTAPPADYPDLMLELLEFIVEFAPIVELDFCTVFDPLYGKAFLASFLFFKS